MYGPAAGIGPYTGASSGVSAGRTSIITTKSATALLLAFSLQGLGMFAVPGAPAAELDGFDGKLDSNTSGDKTYTWGIEYREPLTDHLNGGFVWLNEGHLPHNHRDGQAVQLWWHTQSELRGLVFEAGLGPYRYYDTHLLAADPGFQDRHGWGALASASMDWYFASRWFVFLRLNQVQASDSFDSSSAALGFGYRFAAKFATLASSGDGPSQAPPSRWEVDGLFGERIENSAHSEAGLAEDIDMRYQLSQYFTASVSAIVGQDTKLDWRNGFAVQIWLERHLTSRFVVGAGAGGFIVSEDDNLADAKAPSNLEAMVSVTMAYKITPRWKVRAVWDRIGTGDDHDADIVLLGAGYKF